MTIIPFRSTERVQTDAMSETEASSSIPPWPVDFGPRRVEVEPEDCDGQMVGLLIAYAAIVVVSIGAVAAMLY